MRHIERIYVLQVNAIHAQPRASTTHHVTPNGRPHHFFQHILQRRLVQTKVDDQALKLDVLLLELLQPLELHLAHPGKPLLPLVERRLRHAQLAAYLLHRRAAARLPQANAICSFVSRVRFSRSDHMRPIRG